MKIRQNDFFKKSPAEYDMSLLRSLGGLAGNIFLLQIFRSCGAFLVPALRHPLQRHTGGVSPVQNSIMQHYYQLVRDFNILRICSRTSEPTLPKAFFPNLMS